MPTERTPNSLPLTSETLEALFSSIREVGFPLVGAVDLDLAETAFRPHADRYDEWLTRGYHGEMQYLVRGADRRKDPRLVLAGAESVVVVAIPYRRNPRAAENSEPRYARYLEGPDYHKHLPALLTPVIEKWAAPLGASWKICVDTSAVLERSWAAICGLGWIGKNTVLIHPKFGSYLFLGVILLDRKTGRAPAPLPSYCGNCTACLGACPTEAFVAPGSLDSRKCISYLTLEKRGEWPREIKEQSEKMGAWVAGCDICQEVCPFNAKPLRMAETWPTDDRDVALVTDWKALETEQETEYLARAKFSALSRIKYPEMRRNVARIRSRLKGPAE